MEERSNDNLPSMNDSESQHTPPNPEKGSAKKTKARKGNFSPEDDNVLLSAWLNTSLDSISEVDKSKSSFWDRVHEYYDKNKKSTISERSSCSLRNRWSTIQLATIKFCGALAQIERRSPSGVPEQDKIEQAKELYRSKHSATFNFLHCWTILRHHPKWQQFVIEGSSAKTKRRSIIPDDHLPEFLDEDTMSPYVDVNLEEHNEKAAEKKREREENASSYLIDLVIEMREERRSANVEKGEDRKELIRLTKERLELDKERLEMDKQREENEIMRIDSSALSPMQQEYFHSLQLEVLEKQRSRKS